MAISSPVAVVISAWEIPLDSLCAWPAPASAIVLKHLDHTGHRTEQAEQRRDPPTIVRQHAEVPVEPDRLVPAGVLDRLLGQPTRPSPSAGQTSSPASHDVA